MRHSREVADTLTAQATFAGWATPTANQPGGTPEAHMQRKLNMGREKATVTDLSMQATAYLAGYATPRSTDAKCGQNYTENMTGRDLSKDAALMDGWPTPNAMAGGQTSRSGDRKGEMLIGGLVIGMTPIGSPAETANTEGFQLNPFFSLWLMGFPTEWGLAGVIALRKFRSLPKPSKRSPSRTPKASKSNPEEVSGQGS
jgi:hypothetical protein